MTLIHSLLCLYLVTAMFFCFPCGILFIRTGLCMLSNSSRNSSLLLPISVITQHMHRNMGTDLNGLILVIANYEIISFQLKAYVKQQSKTFNELSYPICSFLLYLCGNYERGNELIQAIGTPP